MNLRLPLFVSLFFLQSLSFAQTFQNSNRDKWFVQMGADMTLQNPYGYDFSKVFHNGKSFGVDAAVGKWFTPEIGLRAKVNWENGIVDSKAEWLAPFHEPGVNHEKGGYFSIVGDILFDVHNVLLGCNQDRFWNLQVFPRAGIVYNLGVSKGSPLIGLGIGNTFRLSDKYSLYFDVAYNGVSSGFTGCIKNTGVGSGSNMFFDTNIGVQYNIGNVNSHKSDVNHHQFLSLDNPFWKGWFLQFGADMTLLTPYGKNLSGIFTKGRSSGLDIALGKWFSPEIGVRGSLNLENFLFENKKMEWIGFDEEQYTSNYDGGGNAMLYFDVMLSLKNTFSKSTSERKWDVYSFGRMGLGKNKAVDSLSPAVGAGLGYTYKINKHWCLYADSSLVGITSEFFSSDSTTGMDVSTGFNGIWDFNVGVQLNIGER